MPQSMFLFALLLLAPGEPSATEAAEPVEFVDFKDATLPLRLEIASDFGYVGPDGELIVDLVEGEYRFLQLLIEDTEGRPVQGVAPTVTPERESRYAPMGGADAVSDKFGNFFIGLTGGSMGDERVRITAGEADTSLMLNIISKRAKQYGWLEEIEGVLDWGLLMDAEIAWVGKKLVATIPEEVLAKSGETVKLAGFMLPLETRRKQSRVLLVSNPPGCFFHVPGGPAGGVEILTDKPFEVTWDPIVVEGRFEALEKDDSGVLYRIHESRILPVKRSGQD